MSAQQAGLLPERPHRPPVREPHRPTPSASDDAERPAWRARLAAALADPALRATPGFPLADDAAILALSDPPYYTACPNPFLAEIVAQWQAERTATRAALGLPDDGSRTSPTDGSRTSPTDGSRTSPTDGSGVSPTDGSHDPDNGYHREPFAADVSEGKNNPIYNAHSYHTKVPHPAIMRYILHYTDPGDIVFDGFCGTGMTGVAAQLCADADAVRSLGYRVDKTGGVWEGEQRIAQLGPRRAVLNDLSPAATFIAYNYNTPVDAPAFEREARRILAEVEAECGWMYATRHSDGQTAGRINYTVWSDIFTCPQCGVEMAFWDVAVDHAAGAVQDDWLCPGCGVRLSKSPRKGSGAQRAERAFATHFDRALGRSLRQAKQTPVLINYSVGKQRYEKRPDAADLALIERIEASDIPYPFPIQPIPKGDKTSDPFNVGITHVHHFYTRRNLWVLAATISRTYGKNSMFVVTALIRTLTKMFRWAPHGKHTAGTSGTLYLPSITHEYPIFQAIERRLRLYSELLSMRQNISRGDCAISTSGASRIHLPNDTVDYIFVDPPFGGNLMYSELNFLWEAWLGVVTNNEPEAVVNQTQRKALPDYQRLMEACFVEFYRLLKPGRWLTVEFHNSANAVWNSIQEAILRAGFMVADVRSLDKQQGSFNQATASGAVKQDLIISAYKPAAAFVRQFALQAGTAAGAWAFVRHHLAQLPVVVVKQGLVEPLAERMAYLLFDRMVAFHIQRGLSVPLAAADFYAGLEQRFVVRDGMCFLPDQTPEYDRARLQADGVGQLALFVSDEKSARQWLRRALDPQQGGGPQSYAELQPGFLKQLHPAKHEALPELASLLGENFLQEADGRWRLPDPRRAADLEALRQKALLREFKGYQQGSGRLRQFRSEAVRAGFAEAYRQHDWAAILQVAGRLLEAVLQEDADLLMYYDAASLRAG